MDGQKAVSFAQVGQICSDAVGQFLSGDDNFWPANADQSYGNGTFAVAAVPEPSAMALLLAGGGLLAWRRRAGRDGGKSKETP